MYYVIILKIYLGVLVMNNKTKYILCAVIGVILFAVGVFSTVTSIGAANDFKVYNEKYQSLAKIDIVLGVDSANTEVAKKEANDVASKFKKFFALSFLMYFATLMIAVFIYFDTNKRNQKALE